MNFLTIICILLISVSVVGQTTADLVLVNGNVRTMDRSQPQAQAFASLRGRIIAVGTNATINALAGPNTKIIDAKGKLVLPGFNDSHVHFTAIGNLFSHLDLKGEQNEEGVLTRITEFVKVLPKGRWLLGSGLPPALLVDKQKLDAASGDTPVLLYVEGYQSAMVNTAALHRAGLRQQDSGIITGNTLVIVRNVVPQNYASDWAQVAEIATNHAASVGVTSVQDVHSDNLYATYQALAASGKLKTRVYECIGLKDWNKLASAGVKAAAGDAMVRRGCVKGMSEGIDEDVNGFKQVITEADKAGLQVMIHAIGATANNNTLDAFEHAIATNGKRDRRFRIEHAHRMRSEDVRRLSRSSIIPSMQPYLFFNGNSTDDDFREMLKRKSILAFGSDASMIELNPLLGIYAAVNAGDKRSITVEQSVAAYTTGSAYAEFQENEKGIIRKGMLADFVILSDDIFAIDPRRIGTVKVLTTVVDGRVVYEIAY